MLQGFASHYSNSKTSIHSKYPQPPHLTTIAHFIAPSITFPQTWWFVDQCNSVGHIQLCDLQSIQLSRLWSQTDRATNFFKRKLSITYTNTAVKNQGELNLNSRFAVCRWCLGFCTIRGPISKHRQLIHWDIQEHGNYIGHTNDEYPKPAYPCHIILFSQNKGS